MLSISLNNAYTNAYQFTRELTNLSAEFETTGLDWKADFKHIIT